MNRITKSARICIKPICLGNFCLKVPKILLSTMLKDYINTPSIEKGEIKGFESIQNINYGTDIIQNLYKLPTSAFFKVYNVRQKDDITQFMITVVDLINKINRDVKKELNVNDEIRSLCARFISLDSSDPYILNIMNTLSVLAAKQYKSGRLFKPNIKLLLSVITKTSDTFLHYFLKQLLNVKINEDSELERLTIIFLQIFDNPELFAQHKKSIDILIENVSLIFEKHKNEQSMSVSTFIYLKKILMGMFKVKPNEVMVRKLVIYLLMKDTCEVDESFICTVLYIFCKENIAKSFKYDVISINPTLLNYIKDMLYMYGNKEAADLYFSNELVRIDKLSIFFEVFILKLLDKQLDNEIVHLIYAMIDSKSYSDMWISKVNSKLKNDIVHSNLSAQTQFILLYVFYMQPLLDSDHYISLYIFKGLLACKYKFDSVSEIEHYMGFLTLRRFKNYLEKYYLKQEEEQYDETKIVIRAFYENLYNSFLKKIDDMDFVNFNRILYEVLYNLKTLDFNSYLNSPIPKKLWNNIDNYILELSNFDFITVVYVLKRYFSINQRNLGSWKNILTEILRRNPRFTDYQRKRIIIALDNMREFLNKSTKIKGNLKSEMLTKIDKVQNELNSK